MKKLTLLILSIILVSPLLVQAESSNSSWKWLIYTDFVNGTKYKKNIDTNSDPVKISDSEFEKLSWSENRTLYSQDKKIKVIVDDQNIYINDKIFIKNDRNYKPNLITSDNKYLIYSYFVDWSNSVYIKNLNEGIDKKWVYIGTVTPTCINVKDNVFYYNSWWMESWKVYKKKYSDILNSKVTWEDILWFDIIIPAVFSLDCKTLVYSDVNWIIYKKWVNKTDKAVAMKNSKWVALKWYISSLYDSSLEPKVYVLLDEEKKYWDNQFNNLITKLVKKTNNNKSVILSMIQMATTKLEAMANSTTNEKNKAILNYLVEKFKNYTPSDVLSCKVSIKRVFPKEINGNYLNINEAKKYFWKTRMVEVTSNTECWWSQDWEFTETNNYWYSINLKSWTKISFKDSIEWSLVSLDKLLSIDIESIKNNNDYEKFISNDWKDFYLEKLNSSTLTETNWIIKINWIYGDIQIYVEISSSNKESNYEELKNVLKTMKIYFK